MTVGLSTCACYSSKRATPTHPSRPAGSSYFTVHNNFAVYGGCAAKNDFEGHDGHHYSNVYAFMGMGLDNGAGGGEGPLHTQSSAYVCVRTCPLSPRCPPQATAATSGPTWTATKTSSSPTSSRSTRTATTPSP